MTGAPRSRFVGRLAKAVLRSAPDAPPPLVGVWSAAPSTNDLAKEAARGPGGSVARRSVFVAERQTAGRGRHGRSWISPPGGLYLSLLTPPPADGERDAGSPAILPFVAGVALAEAVRRETGLGVVIRWPNDVDLEGRKVAGVLVEAGFRQGGAPLAVVGFGINCAPVEVPPEEREPGRPDPGWLPPETDRARLAGALVAAFHKAFDLACRSPAGLLERWERLSPSSFGQPCQLRLEDGSELTGRTDGLGPGGGLTVALDSGGRRVVFVSETIRIIHSRHGARPLSRWARSTGGPVPPGRAGRARRPPRDGTPAS